MAKKETKKKAQKKKPENKAEKKTPDNKYNGYVIMGGSKLKMGEARARKEVLAGKAKFA